MALKSESNPMSVVYAVAPISRDMQSHIARVCLLILSFGLSFNACLVQNLA
jgi:hypothetical protein